MISVYVSMDSLKEVEAGLNMTKDKSKLVLRTAINETAKETMRLLVDETSERYYIKKKDVRKTAKLQKATTGFMMAFAQFRGPIGELYDFRVLPRAYNPKARPKAGHKGNVDRENAPKYLRRMPNATRRNGKKDQYKAFVVRYRSGHITVAQRIPGKPMKSKPWKEAIKTLYAPSVANLMGWEKGVYAKYEDEISAMLAENIRKTAERMLN